MKLGLCSGVLGALVSLLTPRAAAAQAAVETSSSQATGPSMAMVGSGLVVLGVSYAPVVTVGATSGLNADRALLAPVAGPWWDLTQRPGCPASGTCNAEFTDKVLIISDGVLQALGAVAVVGGFLSIGHETRIVRTARPPALRVTPAPVAPGAYGMVALGTF